MAYLFGAYLLATLIVGGYALHLLRRGRELRRLIDEGDPPPQAGRSGS